MTKITTLSLKALETETADFQIVLNWIDNPLKKDTQMRVYSIRNRVTGVAEQHTTCLALALSHLWSAQKALERSIEQNESNPADIPATF